MQRLFVIDASGYLYSSYFAIQGMNTTQGDSTNALYGFIRALIKLQREFPSDYFVAVFDGPNGIAKRVAIYPQYKAHRRETPADLHVQRQWAIEFCELSGLPHLVLEGVEADDAIGSIAKWATSVFEEVYLCTSDKDFCQCVTDQIKLLKIHRDKRKDKVEIWGREEVKNAFGVNPEQMIDLLAMMGDASDNVPGLTGFGQKTAAALLQQFGSLDALLSAPEQVSGKKRQETLIKERDLALLSRDLVRIDTEVPIPTQADFYHVRSSKLSQLKAFYQRMEFYSLLRELGEAPLATDDMVIQAETVSYTLVDDEVSFQALLQQVALQPVVCFDTEATSEKALQAELVGLSFCWEPKHAFYIPVNGSLGLERVLAGIKPLFENPHIGFYGHNVKYDLHILQNYGISIAQVAFDTMLASYLLYSHSRQHSLDHLSLELFGKKKIAIESLIGKGKQTKSMRDVAIAEVCTYGCEDADYTCRLKEKLELELKERGLYSLLLELELPLMRLLAAMERQGIYIDCQRLKELSLEVQEQILALEQEIFALAGKVFNLNSPKQLREVFQELAMPLVKKTATGEYSTDNEVLEKLSRHYPLAAKLCEYRGLEKMRSTYIDALPQQVSPQTGRLHCTFNQSVAATGRLSSQDPNLQNIPIRAELGKRIREAFKPQQEGWSFLAADYSQIELRLLAHFSEDPVLVASFRQQEDIHLHTAASMFGCPIDQVTAEQRQAAKAVNFGILYGQQAYGLSQGLDIEFKEAAAFIERYFARYPGVKAYIEQSKQQARQSGRAVTLFGRERLLPEIHSSNQQLRSAAERLAINTPIQGSQADLIKLAMLRIEQRLQQSGLQAHLLLQIHDELIFEAPDEELEQLSQVVKEVMESVVTLKVPLIVDIGIGKNWRLC